MRLLNRIISLGLILILLFGINTSFTHAHINEHKQENNSLFSGLDSAAAQAVIQFHSALQSGNENMARKLLADDILIYEGGGIERSAEEYANHHMKADMKYLKNLKVKLLEHQVMVFGNMAYSTARTLMQGEYNGKNINSNGMETIVLQKINGEWLITHIHWSN